MTGLQTRNRIPIWRPFVFRNRNEQYLIHGLRYHIKIQSVNRFRPPHMSVFTKTKGRSRFAMTWPPSWKINMTSLLHRGLSNMDEICPHSVPSSITCNRCYRLWGQCSSKRQSWTNAGLYYMPGAFTRYFTVFLSIHKFFSASSYRLHYF